MEFEIGDRVRIVNNTGTPFYHKGAEGNVIVNHGMGFYLVVFDKGKFRPRPAKPFQYVYDDIREYEVPENTWSVLGYQMELIPDKKRKE